MSPKKAPPPILRPLQWHEPPPASPRGTIGSQWGQDSIMLTVCRPNGDLIVEETVQVGTFIEEFLNDLDDRGLVPVVPWVSLDATEDIIDPMTTYEVEWSGETWIMEANGKVDELVWNGMILNWNRQFGYYVDAYGMSVSEPVNATLVTTHARTLIERQNARVV